jgi:hypothetical protein
MDVLGLVINRRGAIGATRESHSVVQNISFRLRVRPMVDPIRIVRDISTENGCLYPQENMLLDFAIDPLSADFGNSHFGCGPVSIPRRVVVTGHEAKGNKVTFRNG